jgi:hypothetical protein
MRKILNFFSIRYKILDEAKSNMKWSGISEGLNTLKYKLVNIEKNKLFTKIFVYYNQTEILGTLNL